MIVHQCVFELSCSQSDRHTDTETESQEYSLVVIINRNYNELITVLTGDKEGLLKDVNVFY